jgi:hypothetical protein
MAHCEALCIAGGGGVSWVIVSRETGRPVLETYSARVAGAVDLGRYEVLTALAWLQRFNSEVKGN